ncbi:MAG TPA: PQQ-binding-like beta-propeller repeat protein [Polyangiaceae bacterium]|nr:PQQ-binding-like beta-propeller repeat protein [Polyangiaceae bacterium]
MKRRPLTALTALLAACALPAKGQLSHAGLREHVGPPLAAHAMPGVDASRSRRSKAQLSATPHVARRLRVAYGIGRGLVTRDDGSVFVLHPSARASRFDAQGKLLYSLKLAAEAASAPVVSSSGGSAFVTAGALTLVDAQGQRRWQIALGDSDFAARSILASRDGSIVVASNGALLSISAFGELVWRRNSPETPLELLETDAGLLCVTLPGSVLRLDASGRSSNLGELGAATQAVTADASGQQLLARTGNHRLVTFDLLEHRTRASIEDATLDLDGPVLFGKDQLIQAFTSDGLLVRYRPDGSEAQRVPIDPGARKAPGNDDVLALADGRLLIARAGADVALVTATGEVSSIAGSACPDPVGIFAVGPSAALLACRSGNLVRLE